MKNNKIITGIVLALLVSILSGGGAYYAGRVKSEDVKKDLQSQIDGMKAEVAVLKSSSTSTKTDTAIKNVYTNTKYGFSFSYPEGWESTKVEATAEASMGKLSKDLVYKVTFSDPVMAQKISCANNESQNWKDATPTKASCEATLSTLTAAQKEKYTGPKMADNIYLRVYKIDSTMVTLKGWLYNTFHQADTNLADYVVGNEIKLGDLTGYYSSIGCCAGVDRNYVVSKGDYAYSFGSSYFENSISDSTMPNNFLKAAGTFKLN